MHNVPRLVRKFKPNSYKLSLDIRREERSFIGSIIISGEIAAKDDFITLHSKDLNVTSTSIDGRPTDHSFGDNDALNIGCAGFDAGHHDIHIDFEGKITDAMHGMYPCYYKHEGIKKELIATQFESHHAREVFPCIDEPEAKAIFDVTLITEPNVTTLGNMPILSQVVQNNRMTTTFETTPVMSSYLLAWVVGELHKKSAKTKNGVDVNVWATLAQPSESLDFPLDIAVRSIDFYDDYFGVPYPLSKCDHVALPDFSSGAMENWGLVTYREMALLADPATTSVASRRYVATVIAHELSHQWFGNLVTMKWWNDLWLNESFASLIEYVAIDALQPDWNIWLDFASFETSIALKRDSLEGVQPVQVEVHHPDEISTLFDGAIVYAKGAHLLQMLHSYIGEAAFRAGLKEYFTKYAYNNTEADDLWKSLEIASGKDIKSFMTSWISKPGFPVLKVSRQGDKLILAQTKLRNENSKTTECLWPITLNSNYYENPKIMETQTLSLDYPSNLDKIVRFNIGSKAHYVTNYDDSLMSGIIKELKSGSFSPLDRLQLLNDCVIMANAGVIENSKLVLLLEAYKNETNEAVWSVISMAIGVLKKFVSGDETAESRLKHIVQKLALREYERLGWEAKRNESEEDTKLRSLIIGLMLYSEDAETISRLIGIYNTQAAEMITPELRDLVFTAAVRHHSNRSVVDKLIDIYKTTSSSDLKNDLTGGLTAARDEGDISQILNALTDTSIIRPQDNFRWIAYLMRNKHSRNATWQWMRNNWKWISKTFGGDKSYGDYPRFAADTLASRQQLQEYSSFFEPLKSDPALTRTIEIGVKQISDRINLIERDSESVKKALIDFN